MRGTGGKATLTDYGVNFQTVPQPSLLQLPALLPPTKEVPRLKYAADRDDFFEAGENGDPEVMAIRRARNVADSGSGAVRGFGSGFGFLVARQVGCNQAIEIVTVRSVGAESLFVE